MSRLPGSQHNPHNQLPTPPRFPVDEALEVLVVQRNSERHGLVRFELQLVVVARQDARSVHLLVVHLEDAGQVSRRRESPPESRGDRMLDVGPVSIALSVLIRSGTFAGRVGGRVQVPDVVPEAGGGRCAEDVCARPNERHADAAQCDAAVEIGEDDVGSALGALAAGRGGLNPCR